MTRHGRASAVVSLLLTLILGVAGTSDAEAAGDPVGSRDVADILGAGVGAGGAPDSLEILSRSAAASGLEGVAHPGPAGGLEPEPPSERELDDDPSSAAMLSWTDASRLVASQRIWSGEQSGADPIHPGANRSRAPPHA